MTRRWTLAAAASAALALAAVGALAHEGATGVVKQRMELMESIGDAMKALTAMMRGKEAYDSERVRALARSIAEHGGERMTTLFPEGSLQHPSEALQSVWTDWERFSVLAGQLTDTATALAAAAGNERAAGGGMMQTGQGMPDQGMMASMAAPSAEHLATMPPDAAFAQLARTCSACHEDFRKEQ